MQPQTRKIGAIAQLVEQRTENPCVPGSIPVAPPKKVHKCFSHMKTLELEIVQGFFFYPHYAFRYIFVKLDFANSVAFFKAFEKAINMHHTSLFFSCLTIPISGVKK